MKIRRKKNEIIRIGVVNVRRKLIIGLVVLMTGAFALPASAQCEAKNDAFQTGEHVMYDLYFNWKFVWVKAGLASLTTNATTYHSEPAFRINLLALGSKRADFFFKMRDTLTCITSQDLVPLYFRKGAEEGKRYTVDEVKFSYQNGKCIVDQQRTLRGNTDKHHDEMPVCVYDMLSILLQARSYDPTEYKPGQKILVSMATGRAVEKQTLIYRRKENYKAENGVTYRCLVFSLVEYVGEEKKEKEVITFYITDDRNHLPVRLDMYLNFGSAKAFLTDIKGNRHPLTSIVKER